MMILESPFYSKLPVSSVRSLGINGALTTPYTLIVRFIPKRNYITVVPMEASTSTF